MWPFNSSFSLAPHTFIPLKNKTKNLPCLPFTLQKKKPQLSSTSPLWLDLASPSPIHALRLAHCPLWPYWLSFPSRSVMCDSLQPHGLQHARLPYPSPTPGVCSNLGPSSQWCHSTISSCRPLLLPPSIFPSIRVFFNESVLHIRWPKYWSFSFSISPSNKYSGLISFRIDRLDLLAVQGILKSLLQHQSWKAPILRCSAFFIVQPSHPYITIGKTIALTSWTFVGKVMSLLFNMLSMLVIAFLPRSKSLLISWLHIAWIFPLLVSSVLLN